MPEIIWWGIKYHGSPHLDLVFDLSSHSGSREKMHKDKKSSVHLLVLYLVSSSPFSSSSSQVPHHGGVINQL